VSTFQDPANGLGGLVEFVTDTLDEGFDRPAFLLSNLAEVREGHFVGGVLGGRGRFAHGAVVEGTELRVGKWFVVQTSTGEEYKDTGCGLERVAGLDVRRKGATGVAVFKGEGTELGVGRGLHGGNSFGSPEKGSRWGVRGW
jgi:hypothetical protein